MEQSYYFERIVIGCGQEQGLSAQKRERHNRPCAFTTPHTTSLRAERWGEGTAQHSTAQAIPSCASRTTVFSAFFSKIQTVIWPSLPPLTKFACPSAHRHTTPHHHIRRRHTHTHTARSGALTGAKRQSRDRRALSEAAHCHIGLQIVQ
jgi:hypothetical protein